MSKESMPVIKDQIYGVGNDTDFSKAIELIFNDDELLKKTDLNSKQIVKLNTCLGMAKEYESDTLADLCLTFIKLRISNSRKGRKEAVTMTQQLSMMKRLEGIEQSLKNSPK